MSPEITAPPAPEPLPVAAMPVFPVDFQNCWHAAVAYARRGWRVVPLHGVRDGRCTCQSWRDQTGRGPCPTPGKHPRTRDWTERATTDPDEIARWFAHDFKGSNVGVATGGSSGIIVVDVDPRHGGDESLEELILRHGAMPETLQAMTGGGGRHYYFRHPGAPIRNAVGIAPGLDIRGDGGMVVAPPSLHASGRCYSWDGLDGFASPILPAPTWLLDLIGGPKTTVPAAAAREAERIPIGRRNSTLASLAGSMRRRGITESAIAAALLVENTTRCDPPLPENDVKRIAASVARYAPAAMDEPNLQKDYGHASVLATLFKDRYRWATHRGGWMQWTGAVWHPVPEQAVAKQAADALRQRYAAQMASTTDKTMLQDLSKKVVEVNIFARITGALNFLCGWPGILTMPEEWDRDPWSLNCENGTLDLRCCTLRPHNPADLLTQLASVAYDPVAQGPHWQQHLQMFLPDPAVRRQVQRDLGLSLVGADLEELLPIWYGTGGNGKSTTLRVLRELLGDYAKMAAPRLLVASKYERHPSELADLCGCRLLFSVEIGNGARLDEERVKMLSGGESVKARFMREDFFEFRRTWTVALVCNNKPEIRGTDNGIWRRIRLIPWTVALPKERQRPQEEVVAELLAEGPAILIWMLEGLQDWQRDHHWVADAVRAATDTYRAEQDILAGFLADCCELGPRFTAPAATLFACYDQWCRDTGEEPVKKDTFRRLLVARGFTKRREGHTRIPTWRGLRLVKQTLDENATGGDQ